MRLRIETTSRPPYWLVGDPLANARSTQSEALTEQLQITRNVQAVAGAGFDTKIHFDRGQQGVSFDATCNRIFTTGLERLAFLASLAPIDLTTQRHLWEGTAWLREDSGTSFIEYALPQCVIMLTGTQLVGAVGLNLTYRIQAGGFSTEREGTSLVTLLADALTGRIARMRFLGRFLLGMICDASTVVTQWSGFSTAATMVLSPGYKFEFTLEADYGVSTPVYFRGIIDNTAAGYITFTYPISYAFGYTDHIMDVINAMTAAGLDAGIEGTFPDGLGYAIRVTGTSMVGAGPRVTMKVWNDTDTLLFDGYNGFNEFDTVPAVEVDDNGVIEIADSLS